MDKVEGWAGMTHKIDNRARRIVVSDVMEKVSITTHNFSLPFNALFGFISIITVNNWLFRLFHPLFIAFIGDSFLVINKIY